MDNSFWNPRQNPQYKDIIANYDKLIKSTKGKNKLDKNQLDEFKDFMKTGRMQLSLGSNFSR